MKQSVEVNGVSLTRAQVEKAWKELNKEEIKVPCLTRVFRKGAPQLKGVVITGYVQQVYTAEMMNEAYKYTVIRVDGGGTSYETEEELLEYWEVDPKP